MVKHWVRNITLFVGLPLAVGSMLVSGTSDQSFADESVVQIDSGKVRGVVTGKVISFKGIPYAAPPIGNLRWRAPQPVKSWKGVRQARSYGNDCIQKPVPGDPAAISSTTSEDCLVLNVWRPADNRSHKKLPVLVWIHGGGFVNGSAAAPIYDGSAFAQQGLVVVSFNYRLGRLGFFAHPALTAAKEGPLGNYGLLDQIAALRWVQRNVAAFGGDPQQVTIAGESAGGISVMHLLTWSEAQGLFQRAIVLSGGGRTYLLGMRKLSEGTPELPSAEESGIEFTKSVGIKETGAAALKALRALPAEVVNGNMNMEALPTKPPTYAGGPIFDGSIVNANVGEILRQGKAANVPLLIGTTSQDIAVTYPRSSQNPLSYFGVNADQASILYNPSGTLQPSEILNTIAVDMTMHEPARFVARQMTAAGNPVWLYRFGYVAETLRPKATGADHASELPYLFSTLDARYGKAVCAKDQEMARLFHTYFANFAKSSDPNGQRLPTWSEYDPTKSNLMTFTPNNGSVMEADSWKDRLDLVEQAADAQTSNAARDLGSTPGSL